MAITTVRLSDEKINQIYKLRYEDKFSHKKIAKRLNIAKSTVYRYVWMHEHGKNKSTAYDLDRLDKRGFNSASDYYEYLATTLHDFESRQDYRTHQLDLNDETAYEAAERQVKARGYASLPAYIKALDKQKQKKLMNIKLSTLLKQEFTKLGFGSQAKFARLQKIPLGAISRYVTGKRIPKPERLSQIFAGLSLPYETIEDILEVE